MTLPESRCSAIGVFFSPAWVPSESTKHVDEGKAICLPPPSSGPNAEAAHYRKLAERKGKRLQCRRSLCQEAFLCCLFVSAFRLHWKSTGVYTQRSVYEMTTERYLAFKRLALGFLEQQTTVSSFFLKYSFRRAMLQLEFRESKSKPEESHFEQSQRHRRYAVCTVGGDDVWTLTTHETRLSSHSTVAYFSSKVLSETSNAPT